MSAKGCPGVGSIYSPIVHAGDCCHKWGDRIVGYMDALGYVHCPSCAAGVGEPMRTENLDFDEDECDGCHKRLVSA